LQLSSCAMQRFLVLTLSATSSLMFLQGCGGGDSTSTASTTTTPDTVASITTTTSTTQTTTTSTTQSMTANPNPFGPLPGADVAKLMNEEYHAYDANDPASSYGVFMRVMHNTEVYCHTGCHSGYADCRVSGSIFNADTMVDKTTSGLSWSFGPQVGDATGWFVNQTEIKNHFGKCAYTGDGGTDNRNNMGCGCHSNCRNKCEDKSCAFYSLDQNTGEVTGDFDELVESCSVDAGSDVGFSFFKGPAFYPPNGLIEDQMHQMLEWRSRYQKSAADLWTEMVLDGNAMLQRLRIDPAKVIPAIVYVPSMDPDAKGKAEAMAEEFAKTWNLPSPLPVVKIDVSVNVREGGNPFVFDAIQTMEI